MKQTCSSQVLPGNDHYGSFKNRDFYKGKSFAFESEWEEGRRYFNDNYYTSFVTVYSDDRNLSALVACKTSHTAQIANKPRLIVSKDKHITGIEDNYAWEFVVAGSPGVAHYWIER